MHPRKKQSKKWTSLPADFSNQIKTVFEQNFKPHLENKKILVEGRIYPDEIVLRVGLNRKGELRYQNFEVSIDHSKEKKDAIAQIHIGVDAIASLMVEFFENEEEHEMPLVWEEYPFEKQKIWLKYSSENPDLEAEANKLLGLSDEEALLQETEDELDALGLAEDEEAHNESTEEAEASEEDEEEIDTTTPQIFGGKKKKKEDLH